MVIIMFSITGCTSEQRLMKSYQKNMENFFTNVEEINNRINSVDPTQNENYSEDFLDLMDDLELQFSLMSRFEVPKTFEGLEELSDECYSNLSNADTHFHLAYDKSYNIEEEEIAYKYYIKANSQLKEMIKILHEEANK